MATFLSSPFRLRDLVQDLHIYLGLFVSPFVLMFVSSTLLMNHTWMPWNGTSDWIVVSTSRPIVLQEDLGGLELAQDLLSQLQVEGEIQYVNRRKDTLVFPVKRPGREFRVKVDLGRQEATVKSRSIGFWNRLFYLHKSPGPHNAAIRGNWLPTRIWRWIVDTVVYILLFLSASGIYLITLIRARRRTGLIYIGAGFVSFIGILVHLLGIL
jgi:hypothetical protein